MLVFRSNLARAATRDDAAFASDLTEPARLGNCFSRTHRKNPGKSNSTGVPKPS